MILHQLFNDFYRPLRLRGRSTNTTRLYGCTIRAFGRWLGYDPTIDDLSDLTLSRYLDHRAATRSPYTAEKERSQLCSLWRFEGFCRRDRKCHLHRCPTAFRVPGHLTNSVRSTVPPQRRGASSASCRLASGIRPSSPYFGSQRSGSERCWSVGRMTSTARTSTSGPSTAREESETEFIGCPRGRVPCSCRHAARAACSNGTRHTRTCGRSTPTSWLVRAGAWEAPVVSCSAAFGREPLRCSWRRSGATPRPF